MKRLTCGEAIKAALPADAIVVCALGSVNRTWRAMAAPQPAYFCSDPMGIALSIALGMALARPHRPVAALCGDGELLLSLSSLATVAAANPPNLTILVFNNRRYETGGAQPLANADVSFAGVARSSGFNWAHDVSAEAEAARLIPELFQRRRLGLLSLAIDPDTLVYGPAATLSQAEERTLFMQKLGHH